MCQKYPNRVANCADPDHTEEQSGGSTVFAQTCLSDLLGSLQYWLINMYLKNKMSHLMRLWYFLLSVNLCMHSHPVWLVVWFLVRPFVYFHTLCVQTAKALARLRRCAGSPKPSLVAYVISTIISWAGSNAFPTIWKPNLSFIKTSLKSSHCCRVSMTILWTCCHAARSSIRQVSVTLRNWPSWFTWAFSFSISSMAWEYIIF